MSEEQNARINKAFRIKGHGREILTDDDIDWLISELERCRARIEQLETDLEEMHQSRKEIIAGGRSVLESWARERRHRKWALKELKEKQALWRNYCGEVSELMNEVKRLKAMLAIGHFVIRE